MADCNATLLATAALRFVRGFAKAARESQLQPVYLAWNGDGFIDPSLSTQELRVAVQHSMLWTFSVSSEDLISALNGDDSARSSINQILQRIIAKLANEVASNASSHVRTRVVIR